MPVVFLTCQFLDIEQGLHKETWVFLWLPLLAGHRTQPHLVKNVLRLTSDGNHDLTRVVSFCGAPTERVWEVPDDGRAEGGHIPDQHRRRKLRSLPPPHDGGGCP